MTEQTTPPAVDMSRLNKATVILTLLAAHPEVAAAPINWEIDGSDELWPKVDYGNPETEACARALAKALDSELHTHPVKGRTMFAVYGKWAGIGVNLQAFGPELAEAVEVSA